MHFSRYKPLRAEKQTSKENTLLGCKFVLLVFSATILRPLTYARNYANLRPRKSNVRRLRKNTKTDKIYGNIYGKIRESVKAEVRPSGSAGDSASLSLSVQPYYFVAACACLGEATPLVYAKHTPRCQFVYAKHTPRCQFVYAKHTPRCQFKF